MARWRYRSGGTYHAPITIRSPFGGGVHTPEMHADSLEGLMAQQPGLKVVIPSTPYDAKGLLISAIRDNDPVDRKSTRLNSSHVKISYAVFCLKKKRR